MCLVLLIVWVKIDPFLSFLLMSITTGLLLGIPVENIVSSVQKGIGDIMGGLVIIICCGAMLGKLIAESGAAQKISSVLMRIAGRRYIQWAMLATGFIIGVPLFYSVGFVLAMPIIFTIAYQYNLPAIKIAIPLLSALSVAQGYLPPHPSPSALMVQFNAGMAKTFLYGLIVAIPAMIIGGPLFSKFVRGRSTLTLNMFKIILVPEEKLPGVVNSFFSALLPVIIMLISLLIPLFFPKSNGTEQVADFLGKPAIVMLISLIIASITLGLGMRRKIKELMSAYAEAVKDISMILLVMSGAGALKQVLIDSNVNNDLVRALSSLSVHPLILGWFISAIIRVCLGSATLAGLTTAGIIAPLMIHNNIDPSLMVLSIGSGSLMFSHVNDPAFWMFKEYLGLTIKETVLSWSLMETIVAIVGLAGVLILNQFV